MEKTIKINANTILTETHLVLTDKGFIQANDLKKGDNILTDKGYTKIEKISKYKKSAKAPVAGVCKSKKIVNQDTKSCPKCKSSWDGGLIVEEFIKQREEGSTLWEGKSDKEIKKYVEETYSKPYRFGRLIGIEIQGGYDGISYYQCPDCKATWNRFTGEEVNPKKLKQ